jgi:hypothetical protein
MGKQHPLFRSCLAVSINVERRDIVAFQIGLGLIAVKHQIQGKRHIADISLHASLRQNGCPFCIDLPTNVGFMFSVIHPHIARCVDRRPGFQRCQNAIDDSG